MHIHLRVLEWDVQCPLVVGVSHFSLVIRKCTTLIWFLKINCYNTLKLNTCCLFSTGTARQFFNRELYKSGEQSLLP